MKRLRLQFFLALVVGLWPSLAFCANKYWVGGGGLLDGVDTTHISDSSGGAGGAVYPSASDTVIFDANSGGGTVTFTAAANFGNITSSLHTGTIDTNGQTVTLAATTGTWTNAGTSTHTINFGASTINLAQFVFTGTNITLNAGTSTINITANNTGLSSAGFTFNAVVMQDIGGQNNQISISGANTFATLSVYGTVGQKNSGLTLSANQTVTGTFTASGNSSTDRLLILSSVKGTQRTITAATVSVTNADFQDIVGAGAGSWNLSAITGGSGDCGGNSGITFTTPATQYWYTTTTGSKTWSTAGNWFLGSGGTGGAGRVPLCQDTARFDASSIGAASTTITQDMPRIGAVDFTGVTNTPTWTTSTAASFFGSITLVSGMTLTANTQTYTYEGRGSSTLTSAGTSWGKGFTIDCVSGTLSLGDALTTTGSAGLTPISGTIDTAGYSVTLGGGVASTGSATRVITLGASTVSIALTAGTGWNMQVLGGLTVNAGTSTIRFTGALTGAMQFRGQGKTYYRLEVATTNAQAFQLLDANTFSDGIYIDASAAARTVQFTGSTNTTVGTLGRLDTTTNIITLSPVSGTFTITKSGGGTVGLDYLNVSGSTGSPASTWYAGTHSTDGGSNSGWIFTDPPSGSAGRLPWCPVVLTAPGVVRPHAVYPAAVPGYSCRM